jgi:hypothetical protein
MTKAQLAAALDNVRSIEESNELQLKLMSEAQLEDAVLQMAKAFGWLRFHPLPVTNRQGRTRTAQKGDKGYPDCTLVHPSGRMLIRELKKEGEYPTPEQRKWLAAFTAAGVDTGVWRPRQLRDGTIEAALRVERGWRSTGA